MYDCIYGFQILCILITSVTLYCILWKRELTIGVVAGLLLYQIGYGLSLQSVTLEGLQTAEVISNIGLIVAAGFWIAYCMQKIGKLTAKETNRISVVCLVGIAMVYLFPFRKMMRSGETLQQNQIFYYIEGTVGWVLGALIIGAVATVIITLICAVMWRKKKEKSLASMLQLMMPAIPYLVVLIPGEYTRYYSLCPIAVLLAVLMIWRGIG